MPYRRKRNVRRRKTRNYKRRNRNRRPNSSIARIPVGLPDRMVTKLMYCERVSFTTTGGTPDFYKYAGNGLFDPNITGGGSQPIYYDNYSAMYSFYRAYASKIQVIPVLPSSVAPLDFVVIATQDQASITGADTMPDVCANKYAKHKVLNWYGNKVLGTKFYMSTSKGFGVSKQRARDDDLFGAPTSANPTNLWYWVIGTQPVDRSSTVTCIFDIKLTFYCQFHGRKFQNMN